MLTVEDVVRAELAVLLARYALELRVMADGGSIPGSFWGEPEAGLDTNAGGDYAEENAVCFLQIILADFLSVSTRASMCRDMDHWGYSFRLGSAAAWFHCDAADAAQWLHDNGLLAATGEPVWHLRGQSVTRAQSAAA